MRGASLTDFLVGAHAAVTDRRCSRETHVASQLTSWCQTHHSRRANLGLSWAVGGSSHKATTGIEPV
jgi:hypothetical protein